MVLSYVYCNIANLVAEKRFNHVNEECFNNCTKTAFWIDFATIATVFIS